MLVEEGALVERDGTPAGADRRRVDARARDRPGRARRAARPARAARARGAAARGRDRPGVLVGRRRRPDAARGAAGGRRRAPGARPQGADPPRHAHVRRRGWLRLRPHPRARRGVRLDAEEPPRRPARALCRLGRDPDRRLRRSSTRSSVTISSRRTPIGSSSRRPARPSRSLAARAAEQLALAGRRALARDDAHAAANLLGRAAALRPGDAALLVDHAEAYFKIGDFARAEDVNSAAIAAAEEAGDARSAIAARLASTLIGLLVRAEGGVDEVADGDEPRPADLRGRRRRRDGGALAHPARGRVLVALPGRPDGGDARAGARARPPRRRSPPRSRTPRSGSASRP